MKVERISVRNFRRLEDISIGIEEEETVFVGPNNSGKTSATAVFRSFLEKRPFRIHDFSVSRIADLDAFGANANACNLPSIDLDIWLKVDPDSIEFGVAFALLPNLSEDFESLGIRLSFRCTDPDKMRADYLVAYPATEQKPSDRRLSEFLVQDGVLKRYFDILYFSLEKLEDTDPVATVLEQKEGKKLLRNLVRVDFVDAQRNIDDEEGHRSNRLSNAFAGFYRNNLEQVQAAADAYGLIDKHNKELTDHYEKQFAGIMKVIKGLGIPSINDRDLKIISSLSPEAALKGSADLLYVDTERGHELPEVYNGLGFKNLIYMAIQAKHYHSQWVRTPENRPLCQLVFIEEPEVHLHAQVQQTFIRNIRQVLIESAKAEGNENILPQLVVTTHSSHILDAIDFAKVRYFRRCPLSGEDPVDAKILNATKVYSLREFKPVAIDIDGQESTPEQALDFLKRYLRLTHCDIFFSDATILVEGAAETLLLPMMIDACAKRLNASYLTILEVGGAYAHRFEGLLSFIGIPYLVITDLDSVEAAGAHAACRADTPNALTSNASIKKILNISIVEELMQVEVSQLESADKKSYLTYQRDVLVEIPGSNLSMRPRTLEEAWAYHNFALLRAGEVSLGINISALLPDAYEQIYKHIASAKFKKTDFAMRLLSSPTLWRVPVYIEEGLKWLEQRLHGVPGEE